MKKKWCCFLLGVLALPALQAQQVGDILKEKAGEGVKQGTSQATSNTADKIINGLFKKKNKAKNSNDSSNTRSSHPPASGSDNSGAGNSAGSTTNSSSGSNPNGGGSLKTYSKYDFEPGEKVFFFEDFATDAIGDLPGKWNSNSASEVQTVDGKTGHWLSIPKAGYYLPNAISSLPDNFTFEYDVLFIPPAQLTGPNTAACSLEIAYLENRKAPFSPNIPVASFGIDPYMQTLSYFNALKDLSHAVNGANPLTGLDRHHIYSAHVAIWRQKARVRVYVNEAKVVDVPAMLDEDVKFNGIRFHIDPNNDGSNWLVSNLKFAVGAPDTRNKLITEGRFSTTGILFDVNSANIKPESYGTLKDIAQVLKDNAGVRVKIVGHTDSDGDAAANLALSVKRAQSVRQSLVKDFGIEDSRFDTDGKGASQPAAPNTTAEGKAQNRRVEFIKE